jgi:hypothetical protein
LLSQARPFQKIIDPFIICLWVRPVEIYVRRFPDGLRFIMIKPVQEESAVMQLNVILNFSEELERLVPTDKE